MSVVGFDFGNSSCVIGVAQKGGIDVILNDVSSRQTPYVAFTNNWSKLLLGAWLLLERRNVTLVMLLLLK